MESLPVLDFSHLLPSSSGNASIHPNGQSLPDLPDLQSTTTGGESFDLLLNLLSSQPLKDVAQSALNTEPYAQLQADTEVLHHLPPEIAALAIDQVPKPLPKGQSDLQVLAQNYPSVQVDNSSLKLKQQPLEVTAVANRAAEQSVLNKDAELLSEQQPLQKSEEFRALRELSMTDGKPVQKEMPIQESRELKPELLAREIKVAEAPLKPELSTKVESQLQTFNTQSNSATSVSTPSLSLQVVEPKSMTMPAALQVEPQPSMTMRLKEFQDFPNAMGDRLAWLASRDQKTAVIRLDPPELGKLELLLNIDGDKVSVNFQASGNAVRELILQQIDRLRMAMAGHDLDLVNVDVSSDKESGRQKDELASPPPASVSNLMVDESTDESGNLTSGPYTTVTSGFLDTFA
ncbi:flagellar hook-length control protein FliK [Endozoicomonas arenosclerae]|uniref:flagellar hook-length control protein FliK n=1 Tax=Endozoicomonas arenosclerae TaxID=1633495 RepID=UPI0007808061|nr:flagellar hook-length control protein FliK [Endozoicomonas arenosclerae]